MLIKKIINKINLINSFVQSFWDASLEFVNKKKLSVYIKGCIAVEFF